MKVFMQNSFKFIRHYPFSCLIIVAIWVLCLIPLPETPLDNVRFIDKWTHFIFYGGLCTVLWGEYGRRHSSIDKWRTLLWIVIAPVIMGGLIEIVQATCTNGVRNGDVTDWLADNIGVVIGQLIGIPLALYLSRRNKAR